MKDYNPVLITDRFYHIYNKANGDDELLKTKDNYDYFLNKYRFYIHPILYNYAYCLMPNHFPFIVKIKAEIEVEKIITFQIKNGRQNTLQGFKILAGLLGYSLQSSKIFSALSSPQSG